MPSMTEITCKCGCGRKRFVRTADVKRGWGLFFNKSCKAIWQERRTGQYKRSITHINQDDIDRYHDSVHPFSSEAHGQS